MTGGNLQQMDSGASRLLQMPMLGSATLNSGVNLVTLCAWHDGMQILLWHQISHILL